MKQAALLVGINRYQDDCIVNLAYAEQDARELYAFLKRTALYDEVRHLPASEADEDRILDAAASLTGRLEAGDLFLFYFAGHGVQHQGRHLLLCPQVRFHRLEFGHHTVPVDLLKKETARSGVSRVFILDACRGNLLAAREGGAQGFRGARLLRDIVCSSPPREGPLSILCSCDEGRQAQELPRLEQGLFSRALLEEFECAAHQGGELRLDDHLEQALSERMSRLARDHDLPLLDQRPWIQRSGEAPALLCARRKEPAAPDPSPVQARAAGPSPVPVGPAPGPTTPSGAAAPRPSPAPPAERTPELGPANPPFGPQPAPVASRQDPVGQASSLPDHGASSPVNSPLGGTFGMHPPAGDKPVAEPAPLARLTVRSERRWLEEEAVYSVLVDGVEVGRLRNGGVASFPVKPGRHALAMGYSAYPRTWRKCLRRRPLDVSAAPIDLDLDPGIERVVDCDVNELSWLLAIPGLHAIMILLLEFTPCRWLQLRQTSACLPLPAQPPAKAPSTPPPNQASAPSDSRLAPPGLPPAPSPNHAPAPPVRALKAHRGGTILALGILGFFTFGLAGISAWIEGNKDLNEMRARVMDPSGWRLTIKGRNLGIAATILWAVIILHKLRFYHFFSPWLFLGHSQVLAR
jgi:hypothetical protein